MILWVWIILSSLTILCTYFLGHSRSATTTTPLVYWVGHQLKKNINMVTFSLLITLSLCQAAGNILYLTQYSVRPLFFQRVAETIKARFPGKQNAELLTDLDPERDPEAYYLQNFQYHLYPVDTKNIRPGTKTMLIILRKTADPAEWIPQDYTIAYQPYPKMIVAIPKHK